MWEMPFSFNLFFRFWSWVAIMVSLSANSTIISSTWPGFVLRIFGFLCLIKERASFAYCPVFPLSSFKVFNSSIVLSRTTI